MPTLWSGDGADAAWAGARSLLAECKPPAVQLHTWEPRRTATKVRAILPGVAIVVGVGVDGVAREVAKGRKPVDWGRRTLATLAARAVECGASAICWNAEAGWKTPPSSEERARLRDVVRGTLAQVASDHPALAQWHTSYDHPTYHSSYNWSDWIGPQSPVAVSLPQVYAAPASGLMAARGALDRREARALASWAAAVRKNWIDADVPDGQPGDESDVDWMPYVQLHHVLCSDTCGLAVRYPLTCFWAIPTRADKHGRTALRALCELYARGFWGEDSIKGFQSSSGLKPDGLVGPKTLAALGVRSEIG